MPHLNTILRHRLLAASGPIRCHPQWILNGSSMDPQWILTASSRDPFGIVTVREYRMWNNYNKREILWMGDYYNKGNVKYQI